MANLPDDPDTSNIPPWELPGAIRRDSEPHRAELLVRLANISTAVGILSLFLFVIILPAVITLALGGSTYVLCRHDLSLMERGLMDRTGQEATENARRNSVTALQLGALSGFCGIGLLVYNCWSVNI